MSPMQGGLSLDVTVDLHKVWRVFNCVKIFSKRNNLKGYPINRHQSKAIEDPQSLIEFWKFDKNKLAKFASNAVRLGTRL